MAREALGPEVEVWVVARRLGVAEHHSRIQARRFVLEKEQGVPRVAAEVGLLLRLDQVGLQPADAQPRQIRVVSC